MNLNSNEVKFYEDIINRHNNPNGIHGDWLKAKYEIEFKDFFIPLQDCIDRDAKKT